MNENPLRLLIVDDSTRDAEFMVNLMRRAGFTTRAIRVDNRDGMQAALKEQGVDIILCSAALVNFPAQQALATARKTGKDVAFILLSDTPQEALSLEVLRAGARAAVSRKHAELVQFIVARELRDLQERRAHRRCIKALKEAEKRNRSLVDSSRDAIAYVHEGMHLYANPVYLNMFGYQGEDAIAGTPVMDLVATPDHPRFKDFLRNYAQHEDEARELEVQGLHHDKSSFSVRMKFSPSTMDGEVCTEIVIQNLFQAQDLENKIKVLSQRDLLTGLFNRHYFLEQLETVVAEGSGTAMLLYLQLDHFQEIKETTGIAASDHVLIDVAALLSECVPAAAVLAHFDDDAFTVLLFDTDTEQTQQLAEQARKIIDEARFNAAGLPVSTSCRIIIALVAEYLVSGKELLAQINMSSTELKSVGANTVQLFNPGTKLRGAREKLQEDGNVIRTALDENRFRLLYQPIMSLHGVPGENYQVLVRMLDEHGAEIEPQQFLSASEQTGLTTAIDRWIISHAIEVLAAQRRAGSPMNFFIKLFVSTLQDPSFLPWAVEQMQTARLEADSLIFELGEATVVSHLPESLTLLKGLKDMHCRFCLDHFGCEASSLLTLRRLASHVNYVKIDGSFQPGLAGDVENQNTIRAIQETARAANIKTIAECVESTSSLATLWQCGVDYVQGYYLQKPSEVLNYDFSNVTD